MANQCSDFCIRPTSTDVPRLAVFEVTTIKCAFNTTNMICDYVDLHKPDASRKWSYLGPMAGHVSNLLMVLRDQLLTHQFKEALTTMEGVIMAYDRVPDIARKAGLEVLQHDPSHYGEALQLFKLLFGKQLKHREEILLDLSLFIAQHGNVEEAYETLHSQISTEPYNSNPLLRGYCGVFQYFLWEKEINKQKMIASIKHDESSDDTGSEGGDLPTENLLVKAHSTRSLAHFDTLWTLNLSQDDNLDYFLETHYNLLVALEMKKEAFEVLQNYDEKFPAKIFVKRLLCGHLREYTPGKVNRRRRYLRALVELDDGCAEVLELAQLLLEKENRVDYCACQELILCYLDYPINSSTTEAWELLKTIHSSWHGSLLSDAWLSRLPYWRELYADNDTMQFLIKPIEISKYCHSFTRL